MNLAKHWSAQLDDYAIGLAWSPSGDEAGRPLLAAASAAGPLSVFEGETGASRHEPPGHEIGANALAWRPAAPPLLASGGQDGAVKFWDAEAGQATASVKPGGGWIEHLAWRPAANGAPALLAAAAGRKLAFFGADGALRHACPDAPKAISALAWRPDGSALALACFGAVRLIESDDFSLRQEWPYANGIQTLAWSPDGQWLVSGNQDPSVHLWRPERNEELQMSGYEGKVKHLSFDPSGRWLATTGGRDACVWDFSGDSGPEGRAPAMLPHDAPTCAVAFQRAHGLLATAAQDGSLHLWSPERRQPLRATVKLPHAAAALAWSPDDGLLAIGTEQGTIFVLRCEA